MTASRSRASTRFIYQHPNPLLDGFVFEGIQAVRQRIKRRLQPGDVTDRVIMRGRGEGGWFTTHITPRGGRDGVNSVTDVTLCSVIPRSLLTIKRRLQPGDLTDRVIVTRRVERGRPVGHLPPRRRGGGTRDA